MLFLNLSRYCVILIICTVVMGCENNQASYKSFKDYPVYSGKDLGLTYSPDQTSFKIWSPTAKEIKLHLYDNGVEGDPLESHSMKKDEQGTWTLSLEGDHAGKFYTYQINVDGQWKSETPGPYAKAVGVNGTRAYVLNMNDTDPEGWEHDNRPSQRGDLDIIIYEIHIRDMSTHPSSGIVNKGKFLGLTETGTRSPEGEMTGVDHLKELGITHVHVLPMFDFRSIDETRLEENRFNWGYEPQNYNAPEGSYATDPYDPAIRIQELKSMIKSLHENGIRVIMDVVYNHTGFGDPESFNMSLAVPKYYYRYNKDGTLSDAAACGNETASERAMMRKYIIESVEYWVDEYHLDGFRFDLMGIHDLTTMKEISSRLKAVEPTIFIYGEGWKAGSSPIPDEDLALKMNIPKIKYVAAFSDEIRDGIKGSWNDWEEPGFVSGNYKRKDGVKFGIVGGVEHHQINYGAINESKAPWALEPNQCIVYVSCHDNHTLYDKLKIVNPEASEDVILKMHMLSNTIVLTSQGIPFLHAGVDFVRSKQGVENSYDSPDSINQLDWTRKTRYKREFEFYQKLIQLRKDHPAFRLSSKRRINKGLTFLEFEDEENVIGYLLNGASVNDEWENIAVIFNGSAEMKDVNIPQNNWTVVLEGDQIDMRGIRRFMGSTVSVLSYSAIILTSKGI